jgi:predicted nuclease of predicted toxin-antitoxin system
VRFFLDHCLANAVAIDLRGAGHDVVQLYQEIPVDSDDEVVIATAQSLDALPVSLNGDFADIAQFRPRDYGGIISLRMENRPSRLPLLMRQLLGLLSKYPDRDWYCGKLIIVEPHRCRIRT